MTMENDLVDKWLVDFCAELSPYLEATSPRKGVYRVEGNGGVSVEFSYNYSGEAAFSHTKNVLRNVFGDRTQALEAELARKTEALRPFADKSKAFDDAADQMGFARSFDEYRPRTDFTHGQLRAARSALEEKTDV